MNNVNEQSQNVKHYGSYKRVIKIEDFLGQSVHNDLIQSNALLAKILNESNEYDFTVPKYLPKR